MESAHDQTDSGTAWLKAKLAWYAVLKAENCLQVRSLLRQHPKLLEVGWGEDLQASGLPHSGNQRTALHVAARRGDVELVEQIRDILFPNEQGGSSSTEFKLLGAKDGDYDLDALAMAVLNGNRTIVNLLKRMSRLCPSNPYGIDEEGKVEEATQLDTTAVNNISNITSKVLSARTVDEQKAIDTMYDDDCDFNFLDKDLYLFHFTFSTNRSWPHLRSSIQKEIFSQAKTDGHLEVLLSKLKDGQGRTALHVAVDSRKVKEFLAVIPGEREEKLPGRESFLNVLDSAGRTPLYRAAAKDLQSEVKFLLKDGRVDVHAEIEYDAHQWGAGLDIDRLSSDNDFKSDCVYVLSETLKGKGFNHEDNAQAGPGPDIVPVEKVFSTALHVSIIHKNEKIVGQLCKEIRTRLKNGQTTGKSFSVCSRRYTWPIDAAWREDLKPYDIIRRVSTLNLAVLVGDIPTLQHLLKSEEFLLSVKPKYFSVCPPEERPLEEPEEKGKEKQLSLEQKEIAKNNKILAEEKEKAKDIPSFLLAAAMGNPGCVKAFLDSEASEATVTDHYNNTALHHALKGKRIDFQPHLIDFVGCQHVFRSRREDADWISRWLANPREAEKEVRGVEKDNDVLKEARLRDAKKKDDAELEGNYGQRQGSINLLLQSGIELWEKNQHERTCCPEHDAPKDFTTWWYEKVAKETKEVQDKLSAAANAIAITASLVATASYTGPLQPPLGYGGDTVQVGFSTVRAFVICDSLSFYFALCALVLALLPSLPLGSESMFDDLVRTRRVVAFAVTFLFPSIICILLAFTVNYFAVIPDDGLAYHGMIVATTVVGGFCCLIVMIWLSGRLFKVYIPIVGHYRPIFKRKLIKLGLVQRHTFQEASTLGTALYPSKIVTWKGH